MDPVLNDDADDSNVASNVGGGPEQCLQVTPLETRIQFILNEEVTSFLSLVNISTSTVAFKVKTTAPKRYMVRPAQGIILSGETAPISIILGKSSTYPETDNPKNLRDKFLVQSLTLGSDPIPDDLSQFWAGWERLHNPRQNKRVYYEHRLRCRMIVPSADEQAKLAANGPPLPPADENSNGANILQSDSGNETKSFPPTVQPSVLKLTVTLPGSAESKNVTSESGTTLTPMAIPSSPSEPSGIGLANLKANQSMPTGGQPDDAVVVDPPSGSRHRTIPSMPELDSTSDRSRHGSKQPSNSGSFSSGRIDLSSLMDKPHEYEKMLAYTVKLTAERESMDSKLHRLKEQNDVLRAENADLVREVGSLRVMTPSGSVQPNLGTEQPSTVLDALNAEGLRHQKRYSLSLDDVNIDGINPSAAAVSAGIQLWQVLAVASLCFLLGRIL